MTETEATPESTPAPQSGLVDLSDLRMMPAWVADIGTGSGSQQSRRYEEDESGSHHDRRGGGRRDDRRGGPPMGRRGGGPGAGGQGGGRGGEFRGRRDGPPGGGQGGGPRRDRNERGGPRRFNERGGEHRPQREWQEIPKDIQVTIEPEDKSAEALAHHIRSSGHAFSMFDAARLVLAEGDRFHARYTCASERPNGLFVTTADGGLFLTAEEATQHIFRSPAIESYYQVEEIELEEPKGEFKNVGVCGISGELLGPPSHHSFQTAIIRLHRERFAHMPLEDYKRRVRVDANPDLVAQWKEKQKKGLRWISIKDEVAEGEEPVVLSSRAEMESHFRSTHTATAVKEVREAIILGSIDKAKLTHVLFIMLRHAVENARKHLFEMSQKLGGGFERRGLKLFKRRSGKLFVSRVKPRAIDPSMVFSERVAKIVETLKSHPGMPLHQLVETLVPSALPLETTPEGDAAPKVPLTEEQIATIKDIRWLANEGYVIEYSDGLVCLGVQGEPNAPKAAKADAPATTTESPKNDAAATAEPQTTESPEAAAETANQPAAEAPSVTDEATSTSAEVSNAETAPVAEAQEETTATESPADSATDAPSADTSSAEEVTDTAPESNTAEDVSAAEAPVPPVSEQSEQTEG